MIPAAPHSARSAQHPGYRASGRSRAPPREQLEDPDTIFVMKQNFVTNTREITGEPSPPQAATCPGSNGSRQQRAPGALGGLDRGGKGGGGMLEEGRAVLPPSLRTCLAVGLLPPPGGARVVFLLHHRNHPFFFFFKHLLVHLSL